MSEPSSRPRRRWWKYLLITASVLVSAGLGALWYTTTASFQAYVRGKIIAELERITGGRAEISSFHVVPFHMQIEVRDITVHGKEAPGEVPLFHVDHLYAQMKVVSFLRTEFGFYALALEHPVVHIAVAPDESTNVPSLAVLPRSSEKGPIEQLFSLSIDHLSVRDGELLWADQEIPLNFLVHDTSLQMKYSFLHGRYESHLALGKVDTSLESFRPFSWMTSVDFTLERTAADIKSLKWNSGRSSLEASGRVSDFGNPHLAGSYEAHIDLQEAASIARRRDLRGGVADLKGNGQWSLNELATSGALVVRDLDWQSDQIALRKASAATDYTLTDEQIKLSKVQGKLFGGTFAGDVQVDNWLHSIPLPANKASKGVENLPVITAAHPPARKGEKAKLPGVQAGSVHLRIRDFSAAEVAAALDTRRRLGNFHPAGFASASLDALWKGSMADAEVSFVGEMKPPAHPAPYELPMTAQAQGKYYFRKDMLELSQSNLTTPESRIQAEGTLAPSSMLHFSVSTTNLEEWRPLVAALGGPTNLPFRVDGNATFNGVVGGSFSSPTLSGTLVAQDFEFTLPATSRAPEQQVHWDSLAANVQFSFHTLVVRGGTLRREEASADFDITATLQNGQFTPDSPYTARVNLHHVDVASTAALAGFDYPVSGVADVSLQISGTRAHPQVAGHISATNAAAYGEAIETFVTDLHIADTETALSNMRLTHQDAEVTGSAAYSLESHVFRVNLTGKDFDLSRVRQIRLERMPIEGRGDFILQGSGTLDAPVINASAHVRDLALGHELAGALEVYATTRDGEMHVSGHSDFFRGALVLDGSIGMHGDFPANLSVQMDHLDLDAFWRAYLGEQLTGHSAIGGTVTLEGPLRHPEQWALNGNLTNVSLDVEYAKLLSQDPIRFSYAQQTLHIASAHLTGDGTDISGGGSIRFAGARELEFTVDGQLDLRFLERLDSDLAASGLATIHMTLGGTLSERLPQGTIQIKNGTASYAGLPSGLSEMNGSITFNRGGAHIEDLTARTGGGTLNFKGNVTDYKGQLNFNLTAVGKDVRLRYPPGVSSTANGELHWVGTRAASVISGDVLVTKLAVTPGFDFGSYLEQTRKSAGITPANSPLYNVKLDVAVNTAPELQMKTAVARLSGDAKLRLRGSAARPSVLGRADILEGDATFNGIKFRLERGDITFANPVAIEPQVNLQATTHVRNYDLDVTVTGTPERLAVNYRSEPPLPKSDIIALLALGRTSQESEQLQEQSGQTLFTDAATNLIINQAINQTVSGRLQKLFGVSRIKIDPQGLVTETNPIARGPQVTIEQQFANNVSLTYSTNVSQSSQQIIQGEYYFTRNVSATGTRDQNGVVSFDIRVRRRRK